MTRESSHRTREASSSLPCTHQPTREFGIYHRPSWPEQPDSVPATCATHQISYSISELSANQICHQGGAPDIPPLLSPLPDGSFHAVYTPPPAQAFNPDNGAFRHVEDNDGDILFQTAPPELKEECKAFNAPMPRRTWRPSDFCNVCDDWIGSDTIPTRREDERDVRPSLVVNVDHLFEHRAGVDNDLHILVRKLVRFAVSTLAEKLQVTPSLAYRMTFKVRVLSHNYHRLSNDASD